MIDTFSETIISVDDAAKHVSKINGKKRNRSVILRWMNRGVSGVRLSAIRIGGDLCTSKEALNRFLNEAQAAKTKRHSKATSQGIRQASLERQAKELGI
jgi:hypothetical protein